MDPRLIPLVEILRLNTKLYANCLDGLGDEAACVRPSGKGGMNSAAFIAAHLVDSRYWMLGLLGGKQASPLKGCEGGFNNINQVTSYPSLSEIQTAWNTVGETLDRQLNATTSAQLEAKHDLGFTMGDNSLLGILTFMAQHESYHLGQLGLLRKHAGLEAMAYS
jgi:uncharacterized damage-inducible protein DinB